MPIVPVLAAALAVTAQAAPPPVAAAPSSSATASSRTVWPALGVEPGGGWVCDPQHEGWRQADLALARADLPKGLKGAAPDLPQLEAALAHAPGAQVGGVTTCAGRTVAFNAPASLGALVNAAVRAKAAGDTTPFTVDRRPMPYADLALLVGSLRNASGRTDLAIAALDRGLVVEPQNPRLVAEKAFALNRIGRSAEAADICAASIQGAGGAEKIDVARLHRSRGYALGEMGRIDEAITEYQASQALDPAETSSANELVYLAGRQAGRPASAAAETTSDKGRKPPG